MKFPHHECEIAQSESVSGKPYCNHWIHVTHLQVEGEKMSKSKGNFFTVRDLLEQGFHPLAVRFALISVPYNRPHNFTMQTLRDAQGHVERFSECRRRIEAAGEGEAGTGDLPELAGLYAEALSAMLNDLNTSVAIAKVLEGVKAILRRPGLTPGEAGAATKYLEDVNGLLGIVCGDYENCTDTHEEDDGLLDGRPISEWLDERQAAKLAKDFSAADAVRDRLAEAGIEIRDTPSGTEWIRR